MVTKLINAAFIIQKVKIGILLLIGAFLAWTGFGPFNVAVTALLRGGNTWASFWETYGNDVLFFGFGLVFLTMAALAYKQTDARQEVVAAHPITQFLEPATQQKLGTEPGMKQDMDLILGKVGILGKPFAWVPGKKWEDVVTNDPEAAAAWSRVQERARRLLGP